MKKIAACILTLLMISSLTAEAFAAEVSYTTITGENGESTFVEGINYVSKQGGGSVKVQENVTVGDNEYIYIQHSGTVCVDFDHHEVTMPSLTTNFSVQDATVILENGTINATDVADPIFKFSAGNVTLSNLEINASFNEEYAAIYEKYGMTPAVIEGVDDSKITIDNSIISTDSSRSIFRVASTTSPAENGGIIVTSGQFIGNLNLDDSNINKADGSDTLSVEGANGTVITSADTVALVTDENGLAKPQSDLTKAITSKTNQGRTIVVTDEKALESLDIKAGDTLNLNLVDKNGETLEVTLAEGLEMDEDSKTVKLSTGYQQDDNGKVTLDAEHYEKVDGKVQLIEGYVKDDDGKVTLDKDYELVDGKPVKKPEESTPTVQPADPVDENPVYDIYEVYEEDVAAPTVEIEENETPLAGLPAIIPDASELENTFEDVAEEAEYRDAVVLVAELGLMDAADEGSFAPESVATQDVVMEALFRLDGTEHETVAEWAADTGMTEVAEVAEIVESLDEGKEITRAELATIMYCFVTGKVDEETIGDLSEVDLTKFADIDGDTLSAYVAEAVKWAVTNGYLTADEADKLNLDKTVTRAEFAMLISRLIESMG